MELGSHDVGRFTPPSVLGHTRPGAGMVDRLLAERIVLVGREIDDELANSVCTGLLLLAAENPRRDVTLYVNSPGGSPTASLAIYDVMQWIEPDVATVVHGTAASTAQLLLTAGATGKRTALPHATIVLSPPRAVAEGGAGDVRSRSEHRARQRREIAELIALHSGRPFDDVVADADRERSFSAAEAVELGLVDRVAGGTE